MVAHPDENPAYEGPRRIQSIAIGMSIVHVVESQPGLGLKDVSARLGMARSKAHLYLATLISIGLVARDSNAGYVLGPYALQLGLSALQQSSVMDVADDALRTLQARTHHSVHLSIWGNRGPTIVRKLDGDIQVPMAIRVGFVLPLLTSATGRIFTTYLAETSLGPSLKAELASTGTRKGAVTDLRKAVRQQGVAMSDSSVNQGFAAMSAPVFDHAGDLCAAITVLDATARLAPDPSGDTAASLRETAAMVTRRLGGKVA